MAGLCGQPSLEFGVKVVRVAGLDPAAARRLEAGGGTVFVRYYVPAGDGRRRLRVDTREVPCTGGAGGASFCWGELARFERWGGGAGAGGCIAFELRWRPRPSASGLLAAALLGGGAGERRRPPSRVLARAELAWRDVLPSSSEEGERGRWLALSPAGRELGGCKAPRLLVEVGVAAAAGDDEVVMERRARGATNGCCGGGGRCGQCGWVGSEEDMFLAATFGYLQM